MIFLQAMVLGVVQGLTEFLPISSSAHLTLIPELFGWEAPLMHSLSFDVALHSGTLLAVVIYFRKDILKMCQAFVRSWWDQQIRQAPETKLAWWIIIGTVPAVVAALLFKSAIETVFRAPLLVAIWLIVFGLVMALAEKYSRQERSISEMRFWDAAFIGAAQALALMPGVSRSGSTITAGLCLKLKRAQAARFAFLLSIPAILGAMVFQLKALIGMALEQSWGVLLLGTAAAALSGYACIKFLLAYLQKQTLYLFVIYRVILGLVVIGWVILK
ncbi:undecaprenyl-diphosphate phosphatase [bacterium]|nr:undecaprenyl-diphosphate phosphatase [bacterium]